METLAEKWVIQGIEQGIARGRSSLQEVILELIEIRFGLVTDRIVAAVKEIDDMAELRRLHRQAATAGSLAEFEAQLS